jgi:biotin transport system substrate-specific component
MVFFEKNRRDSMAYNLTYTETRSRTALAVLGASLLLGLSGPLSYPLPFSPVPISLQGGLCILLAALMGRKVAMLAMIGVLIQGVMGLPVFSLGRSGFLHLLSPTGGYLIGYLAAAYVTGFLMEKRKDRAASWTMISMAMGYLTVYLFGLPQLSIYIGAKNGFLLGMAPFIFGDCLKLLLTFGVLKACRFFRA